MAITLSLDLDDIFFDNDEQDDEQYFNVKVTGDLEGLIELSACLQDNNLVIHEVKNYIALTEQAQEKIEQGYNKILRERLEYRAEKAKHSGNEKNKIEADLETLKKNSPDVQKYIELLQKKQKL